MHRLQIRRYKIRISPRHLKRAVPEHLLQMEHGPAAPKVVDCECVPEAMQGAARRRESEIAAEPRDSVYGLLESKTRRDRSHDYCPIPAVPTACSSAESKGTGLRWCRVARFTPKNPELLADFHCGRNNDVNRYAQDVTVSEAGELEGYFCIDFLFQR